MLIGRWPGRFVRVPVKLATRWSLRVDAGGGLWMSVTAAIGRGRTLA
jgi:hypothetical protein